MKFKRSANYTLLTKWRKRHKKNSPNNHVVMHRKRISDDSKFFKFRRKHSPSWRCSFRSWSRHAASSKHTKRRRHVTTPSSVNPSAPGCVSRRTPRPAPKFALNRRIPGATLLYGAWCPRVLMMMMVFSRGPRIRHRTRYNDCASFFSGRANSGENPRRGPNVFGEFLVFCFCFSAEIFFTLLAAGRFARIEMYI